MLKLMKYEFKKQKFSKLVILFVAVLLEVYFLFSLFMDKMQEINKAMVFFLVLTFGALFFVCFESIFTFSNDLKQKCSYMLFLTPNSAFSVIGAKVLSSAITIILTGLSFLGVFLLNGTLMLAKYDSLNKIVDIVKSAFESIMQIDGFTINLLISTFVLMLCSWLLTLTLAFFAITLSTTFLANSKARGVVSFVIFLLLNIVFSKISDVGTFNVRYMTIRCIYDIFFIVITYVGTAWMLEKKLSV